MQRKPTLFCFFGDKRIGFDSLRDNARETNGYIYSVAAKKEKRKEHLPETGLSGKLKSRWDRGKQCLLV